MIARKFNPETSISLEDLKDSAPYSLKTKLVNGEKLTRTEKDTLYNLLDHNSFSRRGVPQGG